MTHKTMGSTQNQTEIPKLVLILLNCKLAKLTNLKIGTSSTQDGTTTMSSVASKETVDLEES